jgi:outer membrane protein assembly factor BamB
VEALRPGDPVRIGGYLLQARLGSGGMGQVFFARSPGGMPVALKVVHPHFAGDRGFRGRFRREVEAARSVSGAFTAPVIDADPDVRLPWLATAFLPGLSLQDAVLAHGAFPAPAACALGAGLAEALDSIHRAGVVHRDLKPSNVMLGPDGPRVIDFGIAYAAEATVVTQAGHAIGSPGFLSPEQARGDDTGPASDVFSFGAVLCYAATADGPFGRATVPVLLYRVVHEPPRLDHVADAGLRVLIAACLDKDPRRRPAADELLRRLAERTPRTDVLQGTAWLPAPVAADIVRRAHQPPPVPAPGWGAPRQDETRQDETRQDETRQDAGQRDAGQRDAVARGPDGTDGSARLDRRRLLILGGSGAALAAGGVAAAIAAMSGGTDGKTGGRQGGSASASAGTRPAAAPASPPPTHDGKVRWTHKTGAYLVSDPAVAGGIVYVGGAKGNLLALDVRTGKPRWRHRVAPAGVDVSAAPAVAGGVVYMSSLDGGLYALDARTGRAKWRYGAGEQVAAAAVVGGGTVYVVSQIGNIASGFKGGYLTALHAASGAVRWRRRTKDAINSEPVLAGGVLYVPDDSLYAFDAATGRVKWIYKNKDVHRPAVAGGVVYCGNFQGEEIHAIDAATGRRKWKYATGGPVTARPLVAGGTVYAGNWDGDMYALDAATGTMKWQLQTNGQIQSNAALAGRDLVCFGSGVFSAGDVYAVSAATGRPVWRHHTSKGIESSPAVAAGVVYIACKNGVVYALDVTGGARTVPPTAD